MEYFFSKRINAFNYAKLGITKISAIVYAACARQVNILLEIKQIVVVMRIALHAMVLQTIIVWHVLTAQSYFNRELV